MITIFWAGDSTVRQNSIASYPQTGIGQEMIRYIRPVDVQIQNHAENGRSTKSFIDEGRLEVIARRIGPGDFLFIQFGHNDEKPEDPTRYASPDKGYPENLEIFVRTAREKGAIPVIITPLTRYNRSDPAAKYTHDRWADAARKTAARLDVALVDLTALSEQLVDALGEEARVRFYMNLPAGAFENYPEGRADNTHLQPEGARVFAGLIARRLWELGGPYAALLSEEYVSLLEKNEAALRALAEQGADERD